MTRIIAGEFGGRSLTVPKSGTRPTTDRVREAVFSRLDHAGAIRGAEVLDLFAGSGALGFEALSRGAAHVTLVDSGAPAVKAIQDNARALKVGGQVTVSRDKALVAVTHNAKTFSLVFLDPPYDLPIEQLDEVLAALPERLTEDATVVLEWAKRAAEPSWPDALEVISSKAYGETVVHYAAPVR